MINPHIVRKTTSPVSAPPEEGIHWINTVLNKEFFSVGTSSVTDWIEKGAIKTPTNEWLTLNGADIASGYKNLTRTALEVLSIKSRTEIDYWLTEDYTLSIVGSVTRITFLGDMLFLVGGDKIRVMYVY